MFGREKQRSVRPIVVFVGLMLLGCYRTAPAAIIYESATLGTTGHNSGFVLDSLQFLGSGFSIGQTVNVDSIAGHIDGDPGGTLFGTIVTLSGPGALPMGTPFTSSEVVASAVFTPSSPSSEQTVPLSVTLAPGDYAVVFGSGQFGADGRGLMPTSSQTGSSNIGSPTYFFWNGNNWVNGVITELRFVVNGEVAQAQVPEPSTLAIWSVFGGLGLVLEHWRRRRKVV